MKFTLHDPDIVSAYDELPLWSAPFGLTLLEIIRFKKKIRALDVGCGTGFPLIELAQRLGQTSSVIGVDPWFEGLIRGQRKITALSIKNAHIVSCLGEKMPFPHSTFDLIVSNNGLNNVLDMEKVLAECHRVARPDAQMVCTMNLPGTMREFYSLFAETLSELGMPEAIEKMNMHIYTKRKSIPTLKGFLQNSGFSIERTIKRSFVLKFQDSTAFFHHSFIALAFLGAWRDIPPPHRTDEVFRRLMQKLDGMAKKADELRMTIPFVCFDCRRTPVQ